MPLYSKMLKPVLTAIILLAIAANAMAADSDTIVPTGFNAIDHVLQRPAPSHKFENKKFGDHLFVSLEGGASFLRSKANSYRTYNMGYRAGGNIGDWVSPVYGWRVGASAGRHYGNEYNPYFVGASADFLFNFTGLLRGNTDNSKVEFIGAAGLELQGLHRTGHTWLSYGARLGLQMRLNVTPTTFLFIEPRLGVYADNLDDNTTWHSYDMQAQIMAGIGYRMNRLGKIGKGVDNSDFLNNRFSDNLFAGAVGGLTVFGNSPDYYTQSDRMSAFAGAFVGKWLAAPSALRLQIQTGKMKLGGDRTHRTIIADFDYLLNINTWLNGYDPDRKVELNAFAGISSIFANLESKAFIGLHSGVQGVWNISPRVALFIEPQLRVFQKSIFGHNVDGFSPALVSQLNAGIIFRNRPARQRNLSEILKREQEDFAKSHKFFISLGAGIFSRNQGWKSTAMANMAVGCLFTPQSGIRFKAAASHHGQSSNPFNSVSAGVDYMTDILTLLNGYDPDRKFGLRGILGINVDAARYTKCYHPSSSDSPIHKHYGFGPDAGLQLACKLGSSMEIFVEPSVQILKISDYRQQFTPQWRLQAGLTYLMGQNKRASEKMQTPQQFVNVALGSGCISQNSFNNFPFSLAVDYGTWFNDVSGLQLSGHYIYTKPSRKTINVYTLGVDYMLNLTALFNSGTRGASFNLVGLIGPTIGWSNAKRAKADFGIKAGLQAQWPITDNINFTLTPNIITWDNDMYGTSCSHRFFISAQIDAGIAVSF